ncbi:MAG TPA: hypothetical protein DCR37_09615 [Glaciecola sp.]|nr:hypothetical protein [Glaciecola sp.]
MANSKNIALEFYPLVVKLESVINHQENELELIALIDKKEFLSLRNAIISTFQIELDVPFNGNFGSEVEFGDVSDAIRSVTFSLYPQSTLMDKPIDHSERVNWCKKILENMDSSAAFY